ncbi:MAG TPA: hypothetical protein VHX62_10750 [Solirubrobacteraceae bacterium]|jgi:hypothetical protein|nr:hypothetical protein [Solirubrobacteraceae bacterium]
MTDREVEQAAARLARMRVQGWCLRGGGSAVLVAAFAVRGGGAPLQAVLLALAALIAGTDLVRAARVRMMIERLALVPEAYAIGAVRQFGTRAASPSQCELLAMRLRDIIAHAAEQPLVPERVAAYQSEIEELSVRLGRPGARLGPPEAVACRRLLTRCAESALYNRRIPAEDLGTALRRIAAGIS